MVDFWDMLSTAGVALVVVVVLHIVIFALAKFMKPEQPKVVYMPAPPPPQITTLVPPAAMPAVQPVYQPPPTQPPPTQPPQFPAPIQVSKPSADATPIKYDPAIPGVTGPQGIYKDQTTNIQVPTYATPPSSVQNQPPFDPPR